jgi:uncharacterized protein YggE
VVHDLALGVTDAADAEASARAAAFADARRRAEQYAALAGASLGGLVELSEVPPAGREEPRGVFAAARAAAGAGGPPVEGGLLEVTAQVFASWSLSN